MRHKTKIEHEVTVPAKKVKELVLKYVCDAGVVPESNSLRMSAPHRDNSRSLPDPMIRLTWVTHTDNESK